MPAPPGRARGTGRVSRATYKGRDGDRRSASTWKIRYYDRRAGKTVDEYGFDTRPAAEKALRDRLSAQDRGVPTGPTIERTTLEDLAKLITNDYKVNRRGLRRLAISLKHLREHLAGPARLIDEERVEAYKVVRLDEGAAAATINRELAALRRAFRLGRRKVVRVPDIAMLAERNVRKGFFERTDADAVVGRLPSDLRPVALAAYITGWRVASEILTRQWRHVDLDAGWLRLEPGETKNREGRMFPLKDTQGRATELHAILKEQRRRTNAIEAGGRICPWVFHRAGKPIRVWRKDWAKACREAGLPGRLVHDFRRTAVRNMERDGVPRSAAMKLVGHKTEAIYRRYAIVDERMLREAVSPRNSPRDRAAGSGTSDDGTS